MHEQLTCIMGWPVRMGLLEAAVAAANAEAAEAVEERREETRGVEEVTITPALEIRSPEVSAAE